MTEARQVLSLLDHEREWRATTGSWKVIGCLVAT